MKDEDEDELPNDEPNWYDSKHGTEVRRGEVCEALAETEFRSSWFWEFKILSSTMTVFSSFWFGESVLDDLVSSSISKSCIVYRIPGSRG